jgi:uncharacterized protein (TIGR03118 family)
MKTRLFLFMALALGFALFPATSSAQRYNQKNLVSDITQPPNSDGSAVLVDPNLVNPWGLTRSGSSPWWVSDNGTGNSTLYDGGGNPINIFADPAGISPFDNFVIVPPPRSAPAGTTSTPTGDVFNGSLTDFLLNNGTPASKNAVFIFATEDGTISGWNPQVNISPGGHAPSTNVVLEVDNSSRGKSNSGAVYKGATIAAMNGHPFLYVSNFHDDRVEVYDTNFQLVHLRAGAFHDETIPHGYAPFGIQSVGSVLVVTYAKQNPERHDDVAGPGNGFVDIYSPNGVLQGQLQHGPWMNSPWGVVWAPSDFGAFSNTLLIGNFGSGQIAAFNGFTREFIGMVENAAGSVLTIDGLWSIQFGNGGAAGPANTLFFTAGIDDEAHGLFGTLTPVSAD